MFILWKKRPIPESPARQGYVCTHEGPGRTLLTPVLVRSVRKNGRPSREHLWRPAPSIRSCCLRDPAVRWSWWEEVARTFHAFVEDPQVDRDLRKQVLAFEDELVRQLREVVSLPRGRRPGGQSSGFRWRPRNVRGEVGPTRVYVVDPTAALQILGLTWPCTPEEVRRAFRTRAKDAHPDRGGTHEAFIALQQAYDDALAFAEAGGDV